MKINVIPSFLAISLVLIVGFSAGCNKGESNVDVTSDANYGGDSAANPKHALLAHPLEVPTSTGASVVTHDKGIVNYGMGVYYFAYTSADFANALAVFLTVHKDLEVTAMTGNVVRRIGDYIVLSDTPAQNCDYGTAVGYFVTFREKK